jgi:hypothetical protein
LQHARLRYLGRAGDAGAGRLYIRFPFLLRLLLLCGEEAASERRRLTRVGRVREENEEKRCQASPRLDRAVSRFHIKPPC